MHRAYTGLLSAAAVAVAVMATAQVMAQDKIDLVFGTAYQPAWPSGQIYQEHLKPTLSKYSGGRMNIEAFYQAKLCSEHKCWEQAQQGAVDLFNISVANSGAFGQTIDFLVFPYIFRDEDSARTIMRSWLHDELNRRTHKEMDMHIVGWVPFCGYRQILQNVREVRVPEDLKGIKLRVTKSPAEFQLMKAWGAVPVPYDWTQTYQGIQMGVVNGMFNMECHFDISHYIEVMDRSTRVNGAWHILMMNMLYSRYEKLPEWGQKAIDLTGLEMEDRIYESDHQMRVDVIGGMMKKGSAKIYIPTEAETKLWRDASIDVWVANKGRFDVALVRQVLEDQGMFDFIKGLEAAGAL